MSCPGVDWYEPGKTVYSQLRALYRAPATRTGRAAAQDPTRFRDGNTRPRHATGFVRTPHASRPADHPRNRQPPTRAGRPRHRTRCISLRSALHRACCIPPGIYGISRTAAGPCRRPAAPASAKRFLTTTEIRPTTPDAPAPNTRGSASPATDCGYGRIRRRGGSRYRDRGAARRR